MDMKQGFNDRFLFECQHTRAICFFQYITNVESKHQITIEKFWSLPSDANYGKPEIDVEEMRERMERLRENERAIKAKESGINIKK